MHTVAKLIDNSLLEDLKFRAEIASRADLSCNVDPQTMVALCDLANWALSAKEGLTLLSEPGRRDIISWEAKEIRTQVSIIATNILNLLNGYPNVEKDNHHSISDDRATRIIDEISEETRVPFSELIRQGIDILLQDPDAAHRTLSSKPKIRRGRPKILDKR